MTLNDQQRQTKLLKRLILVPIVMFAFAFALIPLYNVLCDATGLNGKTGGQEKGAAVTIDESRTLNLELITSVNQDLPLVFSHPLNRVSLHPGEVVSLQYKVKNTTDKALTIQAIPSVTPGIAARHLKKVECFCFNHIHLEPHEEKELALRLYVDPKCPNTVTTLTLAYTLFNVTTG